MKALFLLLILFSFLQPLRAETTPGGEKPVEGTDVAVPDKPEVTNYTPAKPQDRQKSSAQAKAMAVLGSTQSAFACIQMMNAAQSAKGSDKALMMLMASQACQQGKDMAKAAEENDKGAKQVSADDIPKQSTMKLGEQKIPSGTPKEDNSAMAQYQAFDSGDSKRGSDGDVPVLKPLLPQLDTGSDKPATAAADIAKPVLESGPAPSLPKIAPALIKEETARAEGERKNGEGFAPNLGPNTNNLGPNVAGVGKSPAEEAKTAKNAPAEEGERKKSEPMGSGEGSGGESSRSTSEGSGSSGEKGPDPFEAMLAQIMGGPPPEANGGGGGGSDGVLLEQRKSDSKPPNIFEYATFRYLKLVDQKKMRNRTLPSPLGKSVIPAENTVARAPKLSKR